MKNKNIIIHGRPIFEYDIKKANISVLRSKGLITAELYDELYKADRMARQIKIGLLRKYDKTGKLTKELQSGIDESVDIFINKNNIKRENIIRRSNDALYIVDIPSIKYTKINEYIEFVNKGEYSTYMRIGKLEFFYKESIAINEGPNFKVLGNRKQSDFIYEVIYEIMGVIDNSGISEFTINFLNILINAYKNREFANKNVYKNLYVDKFVMGDYEIDDMDIDKYDKELNIEDNLNILYDIKRLLLSEFI